MDMEVDSYHSDQIETVLEELIANVETSLNEPVSSSNFTSPTPDRDLNTSIFSFVNTCDACGVQDSLFWRRVGRTKTVCNSCFFSQTYLLCFRETGQNSHDKEEKHNSEPARKKTRSSFKYQESQKASSPLSSLSRSLKALNGNGVRNVDARGVSSASSTTSSSCSVKTKANKMETNIEDDMISYSTMTRKSARFINSNKPKKSNENNGKGKMSKSNKKTKSSVRSDEAQSEKASPITSPTSMAHNAIDTTQFWPSGQKSRRTKIFKSENKLPVRSPSLTSTIFTSEFIFHRGFYMQVGDIVALFDAEDDEEEGGQSRPYFAQIRAFLTDQYGEKSAVLTWLIPIDSNYAKKIQTPKDFDPDMFLLGPSEEYPRPLKCLEFVCRLAEYTSKFQHDGYFNNSYQFSVDLQRHKFLLNDLAKANVKLITKQTVSETGGSITEHEIKWC